MINTIQAIPRWPLSEDVRFIAVREFGNKDEVLWKPLPARPEMHMMFMIDSKMHDFKSHIESPHKYSLPVERQSDCTFSGMLTRMAGSIMFKGRVKLLVIHFAPTGFYRLFGIAPGTLTDCLGDNRELFSRDVTQLHEQLHDADSSAAMIRFTEQFLLERRKHQNEKTGFQAIAATATSLFHQPGHYSIARLAYLANMSEKTHQRKFMDYVGVSPKLFARMGRFNQVLEQKMANSKRSWTDICHQTGYYDQMHLIKDFYAFTGESPTSFFNNTPPPQESISLSQQP